ncbi:hypothetical protein BpHYR1_038126 [Brachionus plicatilis]|uniref:Uncharacterized protein n=1 Tax=Brachionus plicatilis TaxID=10195 RepID=A0A3M7PZY8_BRAPC|nr:hypothetical protein BpHYR1_038126 [Brachionus plicatilis]
MYKTNQKNQLFKENSLNIKKEKGKAPSLIKSTDLVSINQRYLLSSIWKDFAKMINVSSYLLFIILLSHSHDFDSLSNASFESDSILDKTSSSGSSSDSIPFGTELEACVSPG